MQIIQAQQAGMEWHEDLVNLATQAGLKGKKLNKVCSIIMLVRVLNLSNC